MNVLDPTFLKDVQRIATDRCVGIVEAIMDDLIVDGVTYGDVELQSDEDFVMFYMDLLNHQLDPLSPPVNLMPYIEAINPSFARQWRERFERASGRLMGVR